MAILTLREPNQRGVENIFRLPDDAADELRLALESADLALHSRKLADQVALKVNRIARADVDRIVATLSRLHSVASSAEVPISEFVDDVYEAMEESKKHQLKLAPDDQRKFKARLASLLEVRAVNVLSKAQNVFVEHEHYLCYARIMTDIRPVFGPDVNEKPAVAMIVHSLKIVYHSGPETKQFFVALDSGSLDRFSELIERAKAKQETLKSVLGTADVQYIETE